MNSITNLNNVEYLINNSTYTSYHTEITPLKEEVPCTFSYNENSNDSVEKEIAPTFSSSAREKEAALCYQARTVFTQIAINFHEIQNNSVNDTQMNSGIEIDSDEETAYPSTISEGQVSDFNQKNETLKEIPQEKWGKEDEELLTFLTQFGGGDLGVLWNEEENQELVAQNNSANDIQMNSAMEMDSDEETTHLSTISEGQVSDFNQKNETLKEISKEKWSKEDEELVDLLTQFGGGGDSAILSNEEENNERLVAQNNSANDTQMNSEVEIDSDEEATHSSTNSEDQVSRFNQEKESSKGILKGRWSKEENKKLADLIAKFGGNPETFNMETWHKIAKKMQSRTIKQIRFHWHQHANPNIKKFQWTKEEDEILKRQMKIHPYQWTIIAQSILGRTDRQVKNHYTKVLVNKRISSWTAQEDNILKNGFKVYGRRWSSIANLINKKIKTDGTIRTPAQCARHWKILKKKDLV